MSYGQKVAVIHRNLRWEVSIAGITRPMVDWLATRERAIAHALAAAQEQDVDVVVVERTDGVVEETIPVPVRHVA